MQYSPKLKKAMEEIKAILEKHDIAGAIVLHTVGHSEYLMKLDPSYSCAYIDDAIGAVRIRSKLADYGGDKQAQHKKLEDTVNLVETLSSTMGNLSLGMMQMSEMLHKKIEIENIDGGHTSHNQQNN